MFKYFLSILFLVLPVQAQVITLNDLSNPTAWYDATDPRTMFDATSGGSLVAIGSPVARLEDKSGNGHHATQSTLGLRPIRATEPVTGRRNLFNYSEQFDNAYWTKSATSITANSTVAPDGTTTADTLVEAASTAQHLIFTNYTIVSGQTYTVSIYAKAAGNSFIAISGNGSGMIGYAYYDLSTGSLGTVAAGTTASIESVGSGWYRCVFTRTATGSATISFNIATAKVNGTLSYAGDGTSGIYLWGSQLGAVSSPTAYQRTITAYEAYEEHQLNRNYLQFDGIDDYLEANSLAATFSGTNNPYSIYGIRKQDVITNSRASFTVSSSSSVNPLVYDYISTANNRTETYSRGDSGAPTASTIHHGTPLNTSLELYATRYGAGGTSAYRNGILASSSATLRGATTVDWVTLGAYRRSDATTGSNFWNGAIYGFVVYNSETSDALTQRITSHLLGYYGRRRAQRHFMNGFN